MMAKKKQNTTRPIRLAASPFFGDTTIIYYRLHSHSLLRQAVLAAQGSRRVVVSNFVRGEYVRGYVYGLLLLFATIRAERSVDDGILMFLAANMNRHRRIQNAFASTAQWLQAQDASIDVEVTLERLGDMVRNCLLRLDEEFPTRQLDPLACEHGVLSFPATTFREDHILDLYQQIDAIRADPGCQQCAFRASQIAELKETGIDLYSQRQQAKYPKCTGYRKQAKHIAEAEVSTRPGPSCWYCDVLGDTIIALQSPKSATILTGDTQSFPALADILNKPVKFIPSLKELKKVRDIEK